MWGPAIGRFWDLVHDKVQGDSDGVFQIGKGDPQLEWDDRV